MAMVVMTVMMVMTVMAVMAMMTVMTATVHHVPTATMAAAVAATMSAAATIRLSIGGGESRHAENNRCGKGDGCNALEHVSGSLVCFCRDHPGLVLLYRSRRGWRLCWPSQVCRM
jgi:hypothetical protein